MFLIQPVPGARVRLAHLDFDGAVSLYGLNPAQRIGTATCIVGLNGSSTNISSHRRIVFLDTYEV